MDNQAGGTMVGKVRSEKRPYYSARTGKVSGRPGIDLPAFRMAFKALFSRFQSDGYFQEAFGDWKLTTCFIPGKLGDVALHIERRLHKKNLWPVQQHIDGYEEDDVFDMVELLFDHASKGMDKRPDSYFRGAFVSFRSFDQKAGRREFRAAINDLLADYRNGFELTAAGEIRALPEEGMEPLMAASLHHPDASNVVQRVEVAKQKFLRRGATIDDRRDAVRDLAGVLEYLQKNGQLMLNRKDESDLFNIANNFAIRHHNPQQKTDYNEEIWLPWMFYFFLATIHTCVLLLEKANAQGKG